MYLHGPLWTCHSKCGPTILGPHSGPSETGPHCGPNIVGPQCGPTKKVHNYYGPLLKVHPPPCGPYLRSMGKNNKITRFLSLNSARRTENG